MAFARKIRLNLRDFFRDFSCSADDEIVFFLMLNTIPRPTRNKILSRFCLDLLMGWNWQPRVRLSLHRQPQGLWKNCQVAWKLDFFQRDHSTHRIAKNFITLVLGDEESWYYVDRANSENPITLNRISECKRKKIRFMWKLNFFQF